MPALDTLEHTQTIAFLGSSSTAGKGQAFDWISELQGRPRNGRHRMHNFGQGGDLAWNALQRVPDVVAAEPDKIVIWIGGNDILASVSDKARRFFTATKQLPRVPGSDWFHENLRVLVRRLKAETGARIALCSLPPIGEALDTDDAFQRALNKEVEHYSALIAHAAYSEACAYIPLYEAFLVHLKAEPGRAFTAMRFLPFYMDAFRSVVLRQDADAIAAKNGWHFHSTTSR